MRWHRPGLRAQFAIALLATQRGDARRGRGHARAPARAPARHRSPARHARAGAHRRPGPRTPAAPRPAPRLVAPERRRARARAPHGRPRRPLRRPRHRAGRHRPRAPRAALGHARAARRRGLRAGGRRARPGQQRRGGRRRAGPHARGPAHARAAQVAQRHPRRGGGRPPSALPVAGGVAIVLAAGARDRARLRAACAAWSACAATRAGWPTRGSSSRWRSTPTATRSARSRSPWRRCARGCTPRSAAARPSSPPPRTSCARRWRRCAAPSNFWRRSSRAARRIWGDFAGAPPQLVARPIG